MDGGPRPELRWQAGSAQNAGAATVSPAGSKSGTLSTDGGTQYGSPVPEPCLFFAADSVTRVRESKGFKALPGFADPARKAIPALADSSSRVAMLPLNVTASNAPARLAHFADRSIKD